MFSEGSWKIIDAPSLVDFNFFGAACTHFVAAICHTNSNQFEFVRQIAATKFFCSDKHFVMSPEVICCSNLSSRCVALICRILCLSLKCQYFSYSDQLAAYLFCKNVMNCFLFFFCPSEGVRSFSTIDSESLSLSCDDTAGNELPRIMVANCLAAKAEFVRLSTR